MLGDLVIDVTIPDEPEEIKTNLVEEDYKDGLPEVEVTFGVIN